MRAFIAIDLTASIREEISKIIDQLKQCEISAKWVKPENIHLTLKFLGNIDEKQAEEVKNIISEVTASFNSLVVNFTEFGFFPNEKRPRVFFVSTDKEGVLKNIAEKLEDKLERLGFPKEGRFKSHITLCRFKELKNIDCLKREMKEISLKGELAIEEIILFKSTLTSSGPIYEKIFSAPLIK